MSRWTRAAAVAALVIGLATSSSGAAAQPEGASSSNFDIDIVVRGTPPPGAQVVVTAPDSDPADYPFALADAAGDLDITIVSGTVFRAIYVDPANDAGASRVAYECTMEGGPVTEPFSVCGPGTAGDGHLVQAIPHVDAWFWGNANAYAKTTITFTFGTCDGRPITHFLADGDVPGPGNDVIMGTPAGESIQGHNGDDRICGGGGPDTIRGGDGRDRVMGGGGNDRLEGGLRGDTLFGGPGNDTLLGLAGNDALDGGARSDTCNGGTERDTAVRCEARNGVP